MNQFSINKNRFHAICFGEVLWDVFLDQKKIGGAPLNVALRLQSLGANVSIISCVGNDKNGMVLTKYIKDKGIGTSLLQINKTHPTGTVSVDLDRFGNATYEINYPSAWDFIELNNRSKQLVSASDVFIFGSLASRTNISKNTLFKLIKLSRFSVFDVNLRKPHYSKGVIKDLLTASDFIKLNDEELDEICELFSLIGSDLETKIKAIALFSTTGNVCVTLGEKGAVLFADTQFYYNPGIPTKVVDTVGAGDSFLASLIFKLLTNTTHQEALDFASKIGSIVAGSKGANPKIDFELI